MKLFWKHFCPLMSHVYIIYQWFKIYLFATIGMHFKPCNCCWNLLESNPTKNSGILVKIEYCISLSFGTQFFIKRSSLVFTFQNWVHLLLHYTRKILFLYFCTDYLLFFVARYIQIHVLGVQITKNTQNSCFLL